MGTYAYYGDEAAGAKPAFFQTGKLCVLKRRMKAADIIASDATLTANAKITANDVIQALQVPAGFLALGSAIKSVTPEGAAETADLGIAGGDELQDGFTTNGAAGAVTLTLHGDDWGPDNVTGYYFSANDTIDVTYKNDTTVADFWVYVWGIMLD